MVWYVGFTTAVIVVMTVPRPGMTVVTGVPVAHSACSRGWMADPIVLSSVPSWLSEGMLMFPVGTRSRLVRVLLAAASLGSASAEKGPRTNGPVERKLGPATRLPSLTGFGVWPKLAVAVSNALTAGCPSVAESD